MANVLLFAHSLIIRILESHSRKLVCQIRRETDEKSKSGFYMCIFVSECCLMRGTSSNTFRRELNSIMIKKSIVVESVDYFAVNLTLPECVTKGSRPT